MTQHAANLLNMLSHHCLAEYIGVIHYTACAVYHERQKGVNMTSHSVFLAKERASSFAEVAGHCCGAGRPLPTCLAANSLPRLILSLCLRCAPCVTVVAVLCTAGACVPLDTLPEVPVCHQENVFSRTGIFQITLGLCYDTRQFVIFYTILPYRLLCPETVELTTTRPSTTKSGAAHKQA